MQISSNSLYDPGFKYSIKLNEKEMLVVEEDPLSRAQHKTKLEKNDKIREARKVQEAKESTDPKELSEDEERLVKDLTTRDSEVKAHEAAHQAAGGGMTGAASYTYQQGPDGKMYAIGGEVSISSPSGSSPEETIKNARQIVAAAMAAGDPSSQDFAVAASARSAEMQAQQQKTKELQEELDAKDAYSQEALSLNTLTQDKSQKKNSFLNLDISA